MLVKQDILAIKPAVYCGSFVYSLRGGRDGAKPPSPAGLHGAKEDFARDKFYRVN
jgi:hypothetical protein